jgi:hypothetical protein
MVYTPISNVAFGDSWSATSHNLLLANAAAPFASLAANRVLFWDSTNTINGVALTAGKFLGGSTSAPTAQYPPGIILNVKDSIAPMSGVNAAALELAESSSTATAKPVFYQLRFDDSTNEGRMWITRMNWTPAAAPVLKIGYRMASNNTSKNVGWVAQLAAVSDGDTSVSAKVFATANTGTTACPDTANVQDVASVTLTNADSVTLGDWVCLFIYRDTSVANDATGDAIVTDVELQYG